MIYIKYIFLLIFVTSCVYKNQNIQEKEINDIITEIKEKPENWRHIVMDTSKVQLNKNYTKKENINLIIDFFEHIKISKFNVINIKNYYSESTKNKFAEITLGRKNNEFRITFIFQYANNEKWKLINLESKSIILEKFK